MSVSAVEPEFIRARSEGPEPALGVDRRVRPIAAVDPNLKCCGADRRSGHWCIVQRIVVYNVGVWAKRPSMEWARMLLPALTGRLTALSVTEGNLHAKLSRPELAAYK